MRPRNSERGSHLPKVTQPKKTAVTTATELSRAPCCRKTPSMGTRREWLRGCQRVTPPSQLA